MAARWKKRKIGQFLFERKGKYQPDDEIVTGIKRIDKIDFSGNFYIATKSSKTNMILVKPGDFVISGINVSKGALGIYAGEENTTATIHYSSYTFDTEKINVEYFKRFLKSPEFVRLLQEQVKGGIKTEIKAKHLLPLEIDLPDIEEQQRIVSYFQSIETEDKELQEEIACQKNLLKKIRQQILQEAIEGKLTAEWRQKNPDAEPASELLSRIQAEKEQLIKDKKIKKQKPLPPIGDEEKPFDLPNGWVWCRLGELIDFYTGNNFLSSDFKKGDGVKCIKITNAGVQKIIETNERLPIEFLATHKHYIVNTGDIVLALTRPYISTGLKVSICPESYNNSLLNQRVAMIKLNKNYCNKGYCYSFLCSDFVLLRYKEEFDFKSQQPNLRKEHVTHLPIPLPPLSEQKTIAIKVEKLLALCDQMEIQITASQTHAKQLMQAVLKEAFSANSEESLAG